MISGFVKRVFGRSLDDSNFGEGWITVFQCKYHLNQRDFNDDFSGATRAQRI